MRSCLKSYKIGNHRVCFVILFLGICFFMRKGMFVEARENQKEWKNETTNYQAIVEDDANLFTDEEEQQLIENMQIITDYGNMAIKTMDAYARSTEDVAEDYYRERFSVDSGSVFLIDMYHREIYIFSDGEMYKTITKAYAYTITDNVYTYASDAEYYTCALEVVHQIYKLLDGQKITQPMKYISNFLIAFLVAFILNFILAIFLSKAWRTKNKVLIKATKHVFEHKNDDRTHLRTRKEYSPIITFSGGSSGGGSGGGSSGGGGGHSF